MAGTILLLSWVAGLILFLVFIAIKGTKLSKSAVLIAILCNVIAIVLLFIYTGPNKMKADIGRIVRNSRTKDGAEVYALLFKKQTDSCTVILNFKDQVIPKIDCCIWMELKLCPQELSRILQLKKYQQSIFHKAEIPNVLQSFNGRPEWWTPQILSDSITKYNIKFSQTNEQILFVGEDRTHVFLCDQAL